MINSGSAPSASFHFMVSSIYNIIHKLVGVLLLLLFIVFTKVSAQDNVQLVKDINSRPLPIVPYEVTNLGNKSLFAMDDKEHGRELWISDGTANGTTMLADINEGLGSSSPQYFAVFNNKVFFIADDGVHGLELWETDGTTSGTKLLADLAEGPNSPRYVSVVATLTRLVFFTTNGGGLQVGISDGTTSGTKIVDHYMSGSAFFISAIALDDKVIFGLYLGDFGAGVFVTNCKPDGISTLVPNGLGIFMNTYKYFERFKDKVYFNAADTDYRFVLFATDGSIAGTKIALSTYANSIIPAKDYLYICKDNGDLIRSDGVDSEVITNVGSISSLSTIESSTLYFSGSYGLEYPKDFELWKVDLTTNNVTLVKDVNPGSNSSYPSNFINQNGIIYFSASTSVGTELWKTDGTDSGTLLVKDINEGPASSNISFINHPVNKLTFFANDGINGGQPWITDGTNNGTVILKKIEKSTSPGDISAPLKLNDKFFFTANDALHGQELFVSDGTTEGTQMVKDLDAGIESGIKTMINNSSHIVFAGSDGTTPSLYASDGTSDGTIVIQEKFDGTAVGTFADQCFFISSQSHVWVSDGTAAGTHDLGGDNASFGYGYAPGRSAASTATNLFFVLGDNEHGKELWKSDGTSAGTKMIKDIAPGTSTSNAYNLYAFGDKVIFSASDNTHGYEPWVTDGTNEGTFMLKDINGNADSSNPWGFTSLGNQLYFLAFNTQLGGIDLWKTDGTMTGTSKVTQVAISSLSYYTNIISYHNKIFVTKVDAEHGTELWQIESNGSMNLFADLVPGTKSSFISSMKVVNDLLFFSNIVSNGHSALWVSDGTATNTKPLNFSQIVIEPYFSLFNIDHLFLITANGAGTGNELYSFTLDDYVTEVNEEQTTSIKMFPNPCEQILHIAGLQNELVSVSIRNSFGKLVLHGYEKSFNDQISFNIIRFRRGYIL